MPTEPVVKVQEDEDEGEGAPVRMMYGFRYRLRRPGSPVYCYAEPTQDSDGRLFGQVYLVDKNGHRHPDYPSPISYYGRSLIEPRPIETK